MDEWFDRISAGGQLPAVAARELEDAGFVVIPGPVATERLPQFAAAYDAAMQAGNEEDLKVASTTTRMYDFVNRGAAAQDLHVDIKRDSEDLPMAGFILMIDEFRPDNGATRFVPQSHKWREVPEEVMDDLRADFDGQVLARGQAGSLIIFNGSVWHGHTANTTAEARRSIQGYFVRREARSGLDLSARMQSETLARIGPLARYVLAV